MVATGVGVGNLAAPAPPNRRYGNRRVLCVAKVRHNDKGVDLLLDAVRLLDQRGDTARLTLVSPIAPRRLPANVQLMSGLAGSQLQTLPESSDLYAMRARAEPHGLVYIESLLAGTPILGPDDAAFPEFAGRGSRGFVLPDLEPRTIADAIQDALAEPVKLASIGSEGQLFARYYTWDNAAARIVGAMINA